MPSLQLFLLFLAADAALKLTPGPDMALTLSRGMTQGFRPAFLSVLGNVAAGFVQVPAVVLGLASVLQASPRLFLGVKAAGGLYLAYLGIKAILRCARDVEVSLAARPGDARDAFWQGFVTNLLNPKVLLFMIAFLPQFTSPEQGPVWSQMLVLGVTMKILSLPYGSCFAYGASRIRGWVGRNAWFLRAQRGTAGRHHAGPGGICALLHDRALSP